MTKNRLVSADMLYGLPEPVQRYMTYSGVIGKPWIDTARIQYEGKFRNGLDRPWMPMSVVQHYSTNPPAFYWKARFKLAGLPLMRAQDSYKAGHGHMVGKVAGLFTIIDARGEEMDQGSMMRYLNEMMWFPIAFLGDNIAWRPIDDRSAEVTFTDCGKSVSARMIFANDGRLTNFIAKRYRESKGKFSLDTWSTPMTEYGVRANLNLPIRGQAIWNLPSGNLPYIDVQVNEVVYNEPIESL